MWSRIARWESRVGGLALIGLSLGCCALAEAQAPIPPDPAPNPAAAVPASRPMTIEERFLKLEAMNRKLAEQNQQLANQLKDVTRIIKKTDTAVNPALNQLPGGPPSTGSAAGGGDLMAAPSGGPADFSAGAGANVIQSTPSTGAAEGGGDLMSFAPDDPNDAKGLKMNGRFGRRFTNNGLWFESPDKNFQFHVGGRYQMDSSFFSAGNNVQFGPKGIGKLRDGVDPRRMRIRLEGAMYENMLFCSEFDFVNTTIGQGTGTPQFGQAATADRITSPGNLPAVGTPVPLDLWITFRNMPLFGNIRIGNQKQPYGFEQLVSSRWLNFMERSFNTDAYYSPFSNGFAPGISTFNTYGDLRGTYAVGLFKNVSNGYAYDVGGGNYAVTGRFTTLLLYEDEGRELMHLGISGRESGYDNGQARFRIRGPERAGLSTVWPLYANSGVYNGSGGQQDINLESVNVFGPWTIDAEWNFHWSQNAFLPGRPTAGAYFTNGGYVEILYFLTGEHRAYVRESGLFDRIVPRENAFWVKGKNGAPNDCGLGAWQVGVRYNYLNLNNNGIEGGILNDITVGLNWFINPNMKFQWNYSTTNRQSPGGLSNGQIQGFGMRFAMDY